MPEKIVAIIFGRPIICDMKKQDAIDFFGSITKLADAIGCAQSSIYDWSDVVPFPRQHQLESITGGKLKAMTWQQFARSRRVAA